jgi:uncharacterized protein
MEETLIFENRNGAKLHGIVHIPDAHSFYKRRIGVNLLNPGIKYRVAPNRLNVKIARQLCDKGYYVLRFDPEGVGDSEGELTDGGLIPDIWEQIQTGRFVSDTVAANSVFIKKYEIDTLIFGGNCGGAISALLASMEDYRVDGLCLIDVPVNLRLPDMQFADKMAPQGKKLDYYFIEYLKRAFRLQNWYRFLTLQTDYRSALKVVKLKLLSMIPWFHNTDLPSDIDELCQKNRLNRSFFEGFVKFTRRKKPVLFIIAGNDAGTEIFKKYFETEYLESFNKRHPELANFRQIYCIENANHIYTAIEWQSELILQITEWIEQQFPLSCQVK